MWTLSRFGFSASCDCVGVSEITSSGCGLPSRSSASVGALVGPSVVDAGSPPNAPDAEASFRPLPSPKHRRRGGSRSHGLSAWPVLASHPGRSLGEDEAETPRPEFLLPAT